MRTCWNCQIQYPEFMKRCLHCPVDLGEVEIEETLAALARLRAQMSPSGGGMTFMIKQLLKPDEAERNLREKIRSQCQLFYDTYSAALDGRYGRKQFQQYLQTYMGESVPLGGLLEQARQLVQSLVTAGDLVAPHRERQRQAELARQDAERRRREEDEQRRQREWQQNLEFRRLQDEARRQELEFQLQLQQAAQAEEAARRQRELPPQRIEELILSMQTMGMTPQAIAAELAALLAGEQSLAGDPPARLTPNDL